jgi:hypothetical protein
MIYNSIKEFKNDFKTLKKKFKTLDEDFETLKTAHIELLHIHKTQTDDPVRIENFCGANYESYKVRKFACKALKNRGVRTGLRVVYVFEPILEKISLNLLNQLSRAYRESSKIEYVCVFYGVQ